tara:strand:+ start:904 stop:1374 length:471 start_codon:yes stop_codon:yes gene_type:complete
MLSVNAWASSLDGAWQSDAEKTLAWNAKNRVNEPGFLDKLEVILGSSHMVFEAGKLCVFLMPQEKSYQGKRIPIYGFSSDASAYEILAANEHGFVLRVDSSDSEEQILMLVFEESDLFYGVSLDKEEFGSPGYREYFRRIGLAKPVNWQQKKCYEP